MATRNRRSKSGMDLQRSSYNRRGMAMGMLWLWLVRLVLAALVRAWCKLLFLCARFRVKAELEQAPQDVEGVGAGGEWCRCRPTRASAPACPPL